MAKKTYIATDANGVVHTRKTDRTYTHTVVGRRNKAAAMAYATRKDHDKNEGSNYDYRMLCIGNGGGSPELCARFPEQYTAERKAKELAQDLEVVAGRTREQWIADALAERLARVEACDYVEFVNLGWCGRYDLALKLASKSDYMLDVQVLEAKLK